MLFGYLNVCLLCLQYNDHLHSYMFSHPTAKTNAQFVDRHRYCIWLSVKICFIRESLYCSEKATCFNEGHPYARWNCCAASLQPRNQFILLLSKAAATLAWNSFSKSFNQAFLIIIIHRDLLCHGCMIIKLGEKLLLCICWQPIYSLQNSEALSIHSVSVGGHCAIFVAIIIIRVTNDLPGAQHISSRMKCQHKDNRGEFRVQL